jgi:mono/diheme cytochrome c family protein
MIQINGEIGKTVNLHRVEKGNTMSKRTESHWVWNGIAVGAAVILTLVAPAWSHGTEKHAEEAPGASTEQAPAAVAPAKKVAAAETQHTGPRLAMPMMNPARGRKLFVAKGCFACHAVNGVGGHDATNLDAHSTDHVVNPFEFAAKMWAMAPTMIAAQEEAMGEQILFTGQELADIIAFVHDDDEQHQFSIKDIPEKMRSMMHHTHGKAPAHQKEIGHDHGEGDKHE